MKEIPLTQNKVALVDDEDYEWLMQWKWCVKKDGNTFYAMRADYSTSKKKNIYMHREIIHAKPNEQVDHIDMNGLNEQKINLRLCMMCQNQQNRGKQNNNISGYKGVSLHKPTNKWLVQIGVQGKKIYLGLYFTAIDAAQAYDIAADRYHGQFARLNFPKGA